MAAGSDGGFFKAQPGTVHEEVHVETAINISRDELTNCCSEAGDGAFLLIFGGGIATMCSPCG